MLSLSGPSVNNSATATPFHLQRTGSSPSLSFFLTPLSLLGVPSPRLVPTCAIPPKFHPTIQIIFVEMTFKSFFTLIILASTVNAAPACRLLSLGLVVRERTTLLTTSDLGFHPGPISERTAAPAAAVYSVGFFFLFLGHRQLLV